MRILVDHSGYDLLNVGDVSMLQACVGRLRGFWPDAEIRVVTNRPANLERYCPGTVPLTAAPAAGPGRWLIPERLRSTAAQAHKMAAPALAARTAAGRRPPRSAGGLLAAARSADAVVAAGGGYVNDTFWWHASGVLSVLGMAQRLGLPTAMFGQGIGPLGHPLLTRQASAVLPRLDVLALREGTTGPAILARLGAGGAETITGDDALEIARRGAPAGAAGSAVGVNLRATGYTGIDGAAIEAVREALAGLVRDHGAQVVALPISRYPTSRDLDAIAAAVPAAAAAGARLEDLETPQELAAEAARCRVVLTASYHAAVFALAQGIPAVCLTRSAYYDVKFAGLAGLFGEACQVVSLAAEDPRARLGEALERAWRDADRVRPAALAAADRQIAAARDAYRRFAERVGGRGGAPDGSPEPRPALLADVELTEPLPDLADALPPEAPRFARASVLVRLHTEPLGIVEIDAARGLPGTAELGAAILDRLGPAVAARLPEGERLPERLPPGGLPTGPSPYLAERAAVLAEAPWISVVVCTRGGAELLPTCLERLAAQRYPRYEVVVVDNAPCDERVAGVVGAAPAGLSVRRVVEPRPGLSWARNRGVEEARGDIVAFIDDDEYPEDLWLAELARGFRSEPEVACVTGMILPAALETRVEDLFEQFGGHSKGRGFDRAVFDRSTAASQSPLYPLPAFGTGANMAFRRSVLLELGGFDVALGAGTPAFASEDTAIFTDLLLAGHRIVYQPTAITRHRHRATMEALRRQLRGYGTGLAAYYTALVVRRPELIPDLVRLAPRAARDLLGGSTLRSARMRDDFPSELGRSELRGMLAGPLAYARSRRRQRAVGGTGPGAPPIAGGAR